MKNQVIFLFVLLSSFTSLSGQVAINNSGNDPDPSALLDVQSSNKGILISRLSSTERDNIVNPAEGLMIFNTTLNKFEYYTGGSWKTVLSTVSSSGSSAEGSGFCSEGLKDINGNVYKTIKIGNKCWMAENLRVTVNPDSSAISGIYDYEGNVYNSRAFGKLYTWNAMMNGASSSNSNPSGVQGICPDGWHIPSEAEWKILEFTLGMSSAEYNSTGSRGSHGEGAKLKESDDAYFWNSGVSGNNQTGFSALPGGSYTNITGFGGIYDGAWFWTSTEFNAINAYYRALNYATDEIIRNDDGVKSFAMSLRCVRN